MQITSIFFFLLSRVFSTCKPGKIVIMEITGREGVLRLHPDLAGKIAEQGGLSTESEKEQSAAGLKELSEEDKSALQYLNERYARCYLNLLF